MAHLVEFTDGVIIEWSDNRSLAEICHHFGYSRAEVLRTWSVERG